MLSINSKKLTRHKRLLIATGVSILWHVLVISLFQFELELKEFNNPNIKGSTLITVSVVHVPKKSAVSFESVDKWLTETIPVETAKLPEDKPSEPEKKDPPELATDVPENPNKPVIEPKEIVDPAKTSSLATTIVKEPSTALIPIDSLPPDVDNRQKIEESKTTLGLKVLVNSEGIPLVVKIESGTSDPLQDYILAEAAKKIVWKNLDPPLKEGETRWIDYNITYATEDPLLNAESEAVNQK